MQGADAVRKEKTSEQYGSAYRKRLCALLVMRGLSCDSAQETAQAAWARGWERRGQLRNSGTVVTWINSIALNMHRTSLRHEPLLQELAEMPAPTERHLAIDV